MRAFLLYIDDWLSSKSIKLMDAFEERGLLRLLLHAATEEDCGLPDDDGQLSVLSELGAQWWEPTREPEKRIGSQTSGEKLRRKFVSHNGRLYNQRLLKEFLHQKEVNEKRSLAGKRGAAAKANAKANVQQMLQQMDQQTLSKGEANDKQTDKQNATNDVCVCVSSEDSNSSLEENPENKPASIDESETRTKPSLILDSDFLEFKQLAEAAGMSGSGSKSFEPQTDWYWAFVTWRKLDPDQRNAATNGIRIRHGTDDFALKATPENYLKRRLWERSVREPPRSSPKKTAFMKALEEA